MPYSLSDMGLTILITFPQQHFLGLIYNISILAAVLFDKGKVMLRLLLTSIPGLKNGD